MSFSLLLTLLTLLELVASMIARVEGDLREAAAARLVGVPHATGSTLGASMTA